MPWREDPTPYAVWVSEVMLQQTQVSVVVPYFERWMAQFPTIQALAQAPLEAVIKAWEGLGYYSRARNLHAGAQYVLEHHQGKLPDCPDALHKIKGLGEYTVGAIRAFAFRKKAAAVDGNVLRVISRYDCIEKDITRVPTRRRVAERVIDLLPDEAPWEVTEALIELGATVCSKQPKCHECPLQRGCAAHREGRQGELPIKRKAAAITPLYRTVAVIKHRDSYLVTRGEQGKVMADLYEFPYWETEPAGLSAEELATAIAQRYTINGSVIQLLPTVEHGFTRYRVTLTPFMISTSTSHQSTPTTADGEWVTLKEMQQLPFSSGHRRILHTIGDIA